MLSQNAAQQIMLRVVRLALSDAMPLRYARDIMLPAATAIAIVAAFTCPPFRLIAAAAPMLCHYAFFFFFCRLMLACHCRSADGLYFHAVFDISPFRCRRQRQPAPLPAFVPPWLLSLTASRFAARIR